MKNDPIAEWQTLKSETDKATRDHDRAEGALTAFKARIKTEHGVDDVNGIDRKLIELKKQRGELAADLAEGVENYRKEWGGK